LDNINRYFTDNKASEKWKIEAAADDIRYQKKYETQFKGSTWPPLKEYLTKQEYQDYQRLLSCHDKYEEEERDLTLEALRIYSADPNTKWERRTQSKMGHARDYESDLYKAAVGDTVHLILNRHRNLKSGSSEYAIILIFVISAVITPPDVVSQILMALPMMALYELGIVIAKVVGKKE